MQVHYIDPNWFSVKSIAQNRPFSQHGRLDYNYVCELHLMHKLQGSAAVLTCIRSALCSVHAAHHNRARNVLEKLKETRETISKFAHGGLGGTL